MKGCLSIHANCGSCTFDEVKLYIQLVIVQLCCTFPSKRKVQHEKTAYDTFVTQCRWGWEGKLPATWGKRESLLKGCVPPESKLGGSQATASNQTCPADGPRGGGHLPCSQAQAREARPPLWTGAGVPLVRLTKQSMLSQQLVKSFDLLFLLRAAELQVLDLGGQLYIDLF